MMVLAGGVASSGVGRRPETIGKNSIVGLRHRALFEAN